MLNPAIIRDTLRAALASTGVPADKLDARALAMFDGAVTLVKASVAREMTKTPKATAYQAAIAARSDLLTWAKAHAK
jgi:hypothetical protein